MDVFGYIGIFNTMIGLFLITRLVVLRQGQKSFGNPDEYTAKLYELVKELAKAIEDLQLLVRYLNEQQIDRKNRLSIEVNVPLQFYSTLNSLFERVELYVRYYSRPKKKSRSG